MMEVKSDAVKDKYCIGTWNVRSMNQGKLEVHLVKAMVFPVVMYGCESWTIKKVEC